MIYQHDPDPLLSGNSDDSLFSQHGRAILAYTRLHVTSREDARDITLEVFRIALERDNLSWLGEGEQLAWLRRVASNKIIDRYRHRVRHPAVGLEAVTETLFDDEDNSPEAIVLRREAHAQLHQAIQQLPTLQQQILRLRYGDRLPFADIARLLNRREDALRKILSRTLSHLRKIYDISRGE